MQSAVSIIAEMVGIPNLRSLEDIHFGEWLRVYDDASNGDIRQIADMHLRNLASSFSDWHALWGRASKNFSLRRECLRRMHDSAQTFREWDIVLISSSIGSEFGYIAINHMIARADSFSEWLLVFQEVSVGSDERLHAYRRIQDFARTPEQCRVLADLFTRSL